MDYIYDKESKENKIIALKKDKYKNIILVNFINKMNNLKMF